VDHTRLVRRLDARGDLHRQLDRLIHRQRPTVEPVRQRLAFNIFEDQILRAVLLLDPVDAGEVGVVDLRERPRLALKAGEAVGILGELLRRRLDGDGAVQPRVAPEVHDAHPAAAELARDFRDQCARRAPWTLTLTIQLLEPVQHSCRCRRSRSSPVCCGFIATKPLPFGSTSK